MKKIVFISVVFLSTTVMADDYVNSTVINGCGDTRGYIAIFEPKTYECEPGKFLPAGATACEDCPYDYTCNGGIFSFNSTHTQGINEGDILVKNVVGGCVQDFGQRYKAIYEPHVINLKWYDGENELTVQPSAQNCTYGNRIILPNVNPTKPGYTFVGWRLKTD